MKLRNLVCRTVGCESVFGRLFDVLPAVSHDDGTPKVKLHGLRMLAPAITTKIPFSSGDSTNVARNIGMDGVWAKGAYPPATKETRTDVLVERMERHQTPARIEGTQLKAFNYEEVG